MGVSQDLGVHTGCYGDVTGPPVGVFGAVASFVSREWGEGYAMGYVGATHDHVSHDARESWEVTWTYVFQVRAGDGSRFAVGATRYGEPFELEGRVWLAFLRMHRVEATVRGCNSPE